MEAATAKSKNVKKFDVFYRLETQRFSLQFVVKEARESTRKTEAQRGKEMFRIRVGKLSALGIVPDGHKPLPPFINSLWLLPPLLPSSFCPSPILSLTVCPLQLKHSGELSRKHEQKCHLMTF